MPHLDLTAPQCTCHGDCRTWSASLGHCFQSFPHPVQMVEWKLKIHKIRDSHLVSLPLRWNGTRLSQIIGSSSGHWNSWPSANASLALQSQLSFQISLHHRASPSGLCPVLLGTASLTSRSDDWLKPLSFLHPSSARAEQPKQIQWHPLGQVSQIFITQQIWKRESVDHLCPMDWPRTMISHYERRAWSRSEESSHLV